MEKYGWDKNRNEGLRELERIIASRILARKYVQKQILETYLKIYKEKRETEIKGTTFYPNCSKEDAYKNASDIMGRLRSSIKTFYDSDEGKESDYEISFAAESGDYRLRIEPKKNSEQTKRQHETVSYDELKHFVFPYRPLITRSIIFVLYLIAPFLAFISVVILFVERTHSPWLIFFVGCIGLILSIGLGYTGRVLNKSCTTGLAYYITKYFLRIAIQDLALVSYSGKCCVPECKGNIFLSNEFNKGTGYVAKCTDYPDGHRFSFDLITLKGERIRA